MEKIIERLYQELTNLEKQQFLLWRDADIQGRDEIVRNATKILNIDKAMDSLRDTVETLSKY